MRADSSTSSKARAILRGLTGQNELDIVQNLEQVTAAGSQGLFEHMMTGLCPGSDSGVKMSHLVSPGLDKLAFEVSKPGFLQVFRQNGTEHPSLCARGTTNAHNLERECSEHAYPAKVSLRLVPHKAEPYPEVLMERGYTNDIEQWHSKTVHFVSTVEDNDLREKGKKLERLLMGEEQVNFQYFGGEDFEDLAKDIVRDIQDHLRANGVYVRKGHGVRISQSLADVVKNDLPWPEDDDNHPPPKPKRDPQLQEPIQPPQPRDHEFQPVCTQGQADEQIPPCVVNPIPNYRIPHLLPSPYQILQDFKKDKNHGHGRELAALAKMYTSDDNKYGGSPTESLNYKFTIFIDQCKKAEIPSALLPMAFPTMLRSMALEYYYSSCQSVNLTASQLLERFQAHFEGEEHRHNMLREWNSVNL
ncbi:MAG: hypothetical protein FRX48_05060 [Lasallia pustulata]|uniref:Uncharacterized protein n=1 Tax=Lasallia pustulata TaxID=136370 RepID=A0A5M8PP99_9LECA|nr:MAG: hypothetical protein FRX48_05060 [Lasallia pustulata]